MELKTVTAAAESGAAAPEIARNQYGLIVKPFRNIGSADNDHLRSVFDQSLSATISQDKRISVFPTPTNVSPDDGRTTTLKPDFSEANATGADLMIAGDYIARAENLLIHAALYDVQKENVKADILYSSKTGFSIFDSIDDMTREFGLAVDKVLPESGKEIVETQELVTTEITTMEKKVSQKDIIEKRAKKKHDIALMVGLGATMDSVTYFNGSEETTSSRYSGPGFSAGISYTYHFTSLLGLSLMYIPLFGLGTAEELDPAFDSVFCLGPEFTFSGLLTDFYLRVLGQYRISNSQDAYIDGNHVGPASPEFHFYGLTIDTGIKSYLYKRYSSAGWYANLGIRFSPYLLRMKGDDNYNTENETVPLDMSVYAGLGVRL
jgi:hypothetical protein